MKITFPERYKVKQLIIISLVAFHFSVATAQTISIDSLKVCAAQEVIIPVTAENLTDVGALTLYVGFDSVNLTFVSVENIEPQLTGMSTNLMSNPMQLAFAWSNTLPVNFPNSKLFEIKFLTNGQNGNIWFNSGCEISDTGGYVINVAYHDGHVASAQPFIILNPENVTVPEGTTAVFNVQAGNVTHYYWRESQDNGTSWIVLDDNGFYTGSNTSALSVLSPTVNYNGFLYQCMLINDQCQAYSAPATLTVDSLTSVSSKPFTKKTLVAKPVPFQDFVTISFFPPCAGKTSLDILDILGKPEMSIQLPPSGEGLQHIQLSTADLKPGLYVARIRNTCENGTGNLLIKIWKK